MFPFYKRKHQSEDFNYGWQMNTLLFRNVPNSGNNQMCNFE